MWDHRSNGYDPQTLPHTSRRLVLCRGSERLWPGEVWQRAGDHEKDGRGTQRTVRSSRSTRRSDCFLCLTPRILEARRALSRQGNRTPSLGNLISPRESPDDTDLRGLLRKWPGQVTHSEGQSPCCTHCANEQSATDQAGEGDLHCATGKTAWTQVTQGKKSSRDKEEPCPEPQLPSKRNQRVQDGVPGGGSTGRSTACPA